MINLYEFNHINKGSVIEHIETGNRYIVAEIPILIKDGDDVPTRVIPIWEGSVELSDKKFLRHEDTRPFRLVSF